jgi:hypothetical protein
MTTVPRLVSFLRIEVGNQFPLRNGGDKGFSAFRSETTDDWW